MDSDNNPPQKLCSVIGEERKVKRVCKKTGVEFECTQYRWGDTWFPEPEFCPEIEEENYQAKRKKVAQDDKERRIAVMTKQWNMMVPPIMRELDKNKLHEPNLIIPRQWKYSSQGLLMHGVSGTGKTRVLWQVLRHLSQQGVLWENYNTRRLQEDMAFKFSINRDSIIQKITSVAVLALDDLGKEVQNKEWESNIFDIIDRRTNRGKPTIITTNFTSGVYIKKFADQELGKALLRRLGEFFTDAPFVLEESK